MNVFIMFIMFLMVVGFCFIGSTLIMDYTNDFIIMLLGYVLLLIGIALIICTIGYFVHLM